MKVSICRGQRMDVQVSCGERGSLCAPRQSCSMSFQTTELGGSLGAENLTIVDLLLDVLGGLSVNSATNRDACAKNFLDGALELSGEGLRTHFLCDFDDLIHSHFSVVDDV